MRIFENQSLANTQSLSIHLEDFLTILIFDPKIIPDSDHFLAHLVPVTTPTGSAELAIILAIIAPVLPSIT
jgi:hypothetical protein